MLRARAPIRYRGGMRPMLFSRTPTILRGPGYLAAPQAAAHGLAGPIRRRKRLRERLRELEEAVGLREPSDDSEYVPPLPPGSPEAAPTDEGGRRLLPYALGGGLILFAIIAIVIVRRRRARAATPNRRRRRRR